MKRATKIAIGVASALSLGLAAVAAGAHPTGHGPGGRMAGTGWGMGMMGGRGPGMMGGGGPGMMGGRGMGMMGGGPATMSGAQSHEIEERLTWQKGALKITPDQESAWQAYANAWEKYTNAVLAQRDAMHSAAAERSDLHNKLMKERFEQLEAVNAAYKSLYALLTPEQRALADQCP